MGRAPEEPDTILIGSNGTFWCRVVGSPGEPAEPKARLMCVAPELLTGLKNAVDMLESEIHSEYGETGALEWRLKELIPLKAVIAKAEGTA